MKNRHLLVTLLLSLLPALTPPANAAVIYVDSTAAGANNGSSWADAYADLQDALDTAVTGDNIWVAQGTYYPTYDYGLNVGDRGKHFRLINGVTIYGGFPVTGDPNWLNRDPNACVTILSGDLLGNDTPGLDPCDLLNDPSRDDNTYHVFYHPNDLGLEPNAVLDGFTVTAGNANGNEDYRHGGGMYNYNCNPKVIGCSFVGNSVDDEGGAMYNYSSSPIVSGCSFTANWANVGSGMHNREISCPTVSNCIFAVNHAGTNSGGMENNDSSPIVSGCSFKGNLAHLRGGGLSNSLGSPIVTDCYFSDNSAGYEGGGMYNVYSHSLTVTDCSFSDNIAYFGGGMHNTISSPTVTDCTFSNNSSDQGGGMCNERSNPIVSGCSFSTNSAVEDGGGMYNNDSSPIVTNCTFNNNSAILNCGGGMCNYYSKYLKVTNCIFSGNLANYGGGMFNNFSWPKVACCTFTTNQAETAGGGMYNYSNSWAVIIGCILWGNIASDGNDIYNYNYSTPVIIYCNIASSLPGGIWDPNLGIDEGGNIDTDPCFIKSGYRDPNGTPSDANDDFWVEGNYHLKSVSPCIDAGDPNFVIDPNFPNDLDGRPRIADGDCDANSIIDMGAYEFNWAYAGDFDGGCNVDLLDFEILQRAFLTTPADNNFNPACDIALPADSIIDWLDMDVLFNHWLQDAN